MVEIIVSARMNTLEHALLRKVSKNYEILEESISTRDIILVLDVPENEVCTFLAKYEILNPAVQGEKKYARLCSDYQGI